MSTSRTTQHLSNSRDQYESPIEVGRRLTEERRDRMPRDVRVICRLSNATRRRITKAGKEFTLGPIDLEVEIGTVVALVGLNGSGKSTLIELLAAEFAPTGGSVAFPGLSVDPSAPPDWIRLKSQIAYIPNEPDLGVDADGVMEDTLRVTAVRAGLTLDAAKRWVDSNLARYDLTQFARHRWSELSAGYKMRCAIVRAILGRPKLMLLDEPMANLDVEAQEALLADLQRIAVDPERPIAIVLSSQHVYLAEAVADSLVILDKGKLLFSGSPKEIAEHSGFNHFEISIGLPLAQIGDLLSGVNPSRIVRTETSAIIVQTPRTVDARAVLSALAGAPRPLQYFRDISRSARLYLSGMIAKGGAGR